jgi:hypothetical protein
VTDIKYDLPNMNNPTIIDLNTTADQDWWSFRPDEDVIFIGADTPRTASRLQTEGGHNIVVLGGDYQPTGSATATLYFTKLSGSVHVEGVHIDQSNGGNRDAIAVYGAEGMQPDVTLQNVLVDHNTGQNNGVHGDIFQTHGAVGDIRIYNMTADTNYQGIFIAPQYDPSHKSAELENVDIKYGEGGDSISYLYWFLDAASEKPFPVSLTNVFAQPRDGQAAEDLAVWPKAGLGDGIGAVRDGNEISWPGLPYTGHITVGSPEHSFVSAADVGIGYTHPGTDPSPVDEGDPLAVVPDEGSSDPVAVAPDESLTDPVAVVPDEGSPDPVAVVPEEGSTEPVAVAPDHGDHHHWRQELRAEFQDIFEQIREGSDNLDIAGLIKAIATAAVAQIGEQVHDAIAHIDHGDHNADDQTLGLDWHVESQVGSTEQPERPAVPDLAHVEEHHWS